MEDNNSKSFKIHFDDDESIQPMQQEEVNTRLPLKKLSQRLKIISIVIPCLISVIIIITYIHLNKKIYAIQNSGSIEVQSLSKGLEEKITALSQKADQINALIENQSKQFDKKLSYVSGDVGKNKNSLKKSLEEKVSKNDLNKQVQEITGKIEDLKKNISKFSSDIQAIDSGLRARIEKELKDLSDAVDGMKKEITNLKQEMSRLSDTGINQKELDFALDLQAKRYKTELRQAIADLEKKIASSRKETESQKKAGNASIKNTEGSLKIPPLKSEPVQKPAADSLKDNKIIEQDISE
jgi:predicted  nucleic acid-binding Zn-ribbon protein